MTSSGGRTARAPTARTSSGASSASRIIPGLLQRALREFSAAGLSMPWLSCFGNHEALNQGVGTQTPGLAAALTGGKKPIGLPEDFDHDQALEHVHRAPRGVHGRARTARSRPIPSAGRSPGGTSSTPTCGPARGRSATGSPSGTGWTAPRTTSTTRPRCGSSRWTPTAWPAARPGAWTREQARWLEARLAEVHSAYRGADGGEVRTGHDDRLVILFSHHGTDTLDNSRGGHAGPDGEPLLGAGLRGPAAPVPQRGPVAERPHAHQHDPPAPRPG